jgi:hypothetical protein
MASTQPGRANIIRIGMRCRQCNHEWSTDVPTVPPDPVETTSD